MLSRLVRRALLALLHWLAAVGEWWRGRNGMRTGAGRASYAAQLAEVPGRRAAHASVLVDRHHLTLRDMAHLALWSLLAGVPYLSFYDVDGTLKRDEEKLFAEVEKLKRGVPGCIKWADRPALNGYTNGHKPFTTTINIFTVSDGKQRIAEFTKEIIQHKLQCKRKSDQYSAEEIDFALKKYYPSIPDPDIVMFCGPVCYTKGLLPWQIRLSMFIPLNSNGGVQVEDFVNVLRRYSRCDQRFGK